MIRVSIAALILSLSLGTAVFAERPALDTEQSSFSVQTRTAFWLPIRIAIPDGAYVYGNPKGPGTGKALEIEISAPSEVSFLKPRISPFEVYHPQNDNFVNVYRKSLTIFLPVTVSKEGTFHATASISGLMCTDRACTPFALQKTMTLVASDKPAGSLLMSVPTGTIEFGALPGSSVELPAKTGSSPVPDITFTPRFLSSSVHGILSALLFGFLAGILLNIMPCVLPVLALKIAGVVKNAHDRKRTVEGGLLYAAGIMSFFLLISVLVIFAGYRWGSFFQSSSFLIIVILVLFSFALSLLGVFTLQMPSFTAKAVSRKRTFLLDSFTKGFLAALLATPCSGPFLGSVLAWSLTRSGAEKAAVFLSIGFGLSFPYLFVTIFPSLVRFIPKPGKWTIVFEKIMGTLLIVSAVYFTLILNRTYYLPVAAMVFIATVGLWQYGRFGSPIRAAVIRRSSLVLLILFLAAAVFIPLNVKPAALPPRSVPFSVEAVHDVSSAGRISVVVFTADWCPNCKLVEKTVLESERIEELVREKNITVFYADITGKGTNGEDLLTRLGGTAVPFLAVFPAGEKFTSPICLRDIYTVNDFEEAVRAAEK